MVTLHCVTHPQAQQGKVCILFKISDENLLQIFKVVTFKHLHQVCVPMHANAAVVEQPSWWKHSDQKVPHHSFQKTRGGTAGERGADEETMLCGDSWRIPTWQDEYSMYVNLQMSTTYNTFRFAVDVCWPSHWRIRQLLRDALNEAKDPLGSYLEES